MILSGIKVNLQALIFAFKLDRVGLLLADPLNANLINDTNLHLFDDRVDTIFAS